ncbi:MAG: transposase family protein [Ktedonobacteraceae bacterium]|nr:transposase family protein [Ktedonobacteraceae bacterium]
MAKPTLLPDPTCLHLKLLDASETAITAVVTTISEEAECPLCHRRSARIHSRYERSVADLPWMGCAVRLQLHVRCFFCSNQECARQIFTERLPTVVAPYARRTMRLADVFTIIGFAIGGEAGKRLVAGMGLSTSPDTLLRLIRTQQEPQRPTPRVLGVDDFSFIIMKMTEPPTRTRINPHYKPLIEPYKDYVIKRWNEGCRNAQQVHRELKEFGYTGSDQPIVSCASSLSFARRKMPENSNQLFLARLPSSKRLRSVHLPPPKLRIGSPLKRNRIWIGSRTI